MSFTTWRWLTTVTCSVLGRRWSSHSSEWVAYLVEFYRRLAVFCRVRGSYEQPAPARYVGLRGTTLAARRALNNLVHPFALPFERGVLRWSVVPRSFAHFGEGIAFY